MPQETCSPFIENIPAYALGALNGEETRALQSHLQTCASCQAELEAYAAVTQGLLLSIPLQAPPAALRSRLRDRLPSRQSGPQKAPWPHFTWSASAATLAAILVLLVFLNVFTIFQVITLQRQQAHLASQFNASQTALAMLAYPGTQTLPFADGGISGSLLLDKERNVAVLIAWDLPQSEKGQAYQIWLIDPQGNRTSAGLFRTEAGLPFTSAAILPQGNLSNFIGIGITVEPLEGSPQPTGERVFKVDL